MLYALLKLVHLLSVIIWIGGMVFAHFALRPAVASLAPPTRLPLMHDVLGRFFSVVLWASCLSVVTGVVMMGQAARQIVQAGGQFQMPLGWTVMATLGIVMLLIFGHIRFAMYRRLSRAVAAQDWPAGAAALGGIRKLVLLNLCLGVLAVAAVVLL
ncbi:putative exported protein [plant metagenome]|uniref:Putative exported protein n=1 Tax=plant metagenome TaxID=1297885 RepID=A0A484UX06_9ZZZZ